VKMNAPGPARPPTRGLDDVVLADAGPCPARGARLIEITAIVMEGNTVKPARRPTETVPAPK